MFIYGLFLLLFQLTLWNGAGRRPSILPVPDMFSGSTINLAAGHQVSNDDSEDEIDDDVPWRGPTEKIA